MIRHVLSVGLVPMYDMAYATHDMKKYVNRNIDLHLRKFLY